MAETDTTIATVTHSVRAGEHEVASFDIALHASTSTTDGGLGVTIHVDAERYRLELASALIEAGTSLLGPAHEVGPHEPMVGTPMDLDADAAARWDSLEQARAEHALMDSPDWRDGPEHLIYGERQTGKTTLAVRWLSEAPEGVRRVLIVPNDSIARTVREEMGWTVTDDRVRSWRQQVNRGHRRAEPEGIEYGVDESVEVLTQVLNLPRVPSLLTVALAADHQRPAYRRS